MEKSNEMKGKIILWGLLCLTFIVAIFSSRNEQEEKRSLTTEPEKVTVGISNLGQSDISSITDIQINSLKTTMLSDSISISLKAVPKKSMRLLTPKEELNLILPELMEYQFTHTPMPSFKGNVSNPLDWKKYILFVDSLLPRGLKPDCYFLEEDSMMFRSLNNDKKESDIFLCMSNPILMYKNVAWGLTENYVYTTTAYLLKENRKVVRMMLPQPELLLSKDMWDIFIEHEFVHAKELLGMLPAAEYCDAEMLAYVSCLNLLKSKNKRTSNALVKYAGRFYQQYGFTNELREMCAVLYRTNELSFLEKDLVEPALLLMVAMSAENIRGYKKDNEKFAKKMNDLYVYLNSNEALAYQ